MVKKEQKDKEIRELPKVEKNFSFIKGDSVNFKDFLSGINIPCLRDS